MSIMIRDSDMPNGDILGEELYQKRASRALPILVKQAELRKEISYSALAQEIKMPNPRNLNHVLDCVGIRLEALSREWGEAIPQIQTAVINKGTGLPSEGIGWLFKGKERERSLTRYQSRSARGGCTQNGRRSTITRNGGTFSKQWGLNRWTPRLQTL